MLRSHRKSLHGTSAQPAPAGAAPLANAGTVLRDTLLCVLFYVYLWQVVDLRLIANGAGIITNFPVFYTGWSYFEGFLHYPGGMVEYAGAFLSQFFYVGWAGAAVATLQAALTCAATDFILKRFGLPTLRWLRFVPAVFLLATYTQYSFHFVTATALTVSLLFACFYLLVTGADMSRATGRSAIRLSLFAALSIILYTLAGGAYLLFATLVVLYELEFELPTSLVDAITPVEDELQQRVEGSEFQHPIVEGWLFEIQLFCASCAVGVFDADCVPAPGVEVDVAVHDRGQVQAVERYRVVYHIIIGFDILIRSYYDGVFLGRLYHSVGLLRFLAVVSDEFRVGAIRIDLFEGLKNFLDFHCSFAPSSNEILKALVPIANSISDTISRPPSLEGEPRSGIRPKA